jgi:putative aldouronate transport system permease protein
MKNKGFQIQYHLMLIPGVCLLLLFSVLPMFGIVIAFQKFIPAKGIFDSPWIGLDNFRYMFQIPDSKQIFLNTVIIAVSKIVMNLIVPLLFALLLNEVRIKWFKRAVQTMVYLPHFLSWVILAGMFTSNIFSLDGMINQLLNLFGIDSIFFMASNFWFRPIIVLTDVWKEFGFGTIVYLAAITGLDPGLYESAVIDGASRFQKVIYVTLPGIASTIVLLGTLSLGNVLNANFDQIFNMYNSLVLQTGDIIDTYVYRAGLMGAKYGLATAVGLMKSVISFFLIMTSYKLAAKFANYRIF